MSATPRSLKLLKSCRYRYSPCTCPAYRWPEDVSTLDAAYAHTTIDSIMIGAEMISASAILPPNTAMMPETSASAAPRPPIQLASVPPSRVAPSIANSDEHASVNRFSALYPFFQSSQCRFMPPRSNTGDPTRLETFCIRLSAARSLWLRLSSRSASLSNPAGSSTMVIVLPSDFALPSSAPIMPARRTLSALLMSTPRYRLDGPG